MLYSNLTDIDYNLNVRFNGEKLKFKSYENFLGVIIDSGLKFAEHIRVTCNKLSKSVGLLYRLRDFVPHNILINLYYSLVYPYILYGNIVWGGTYGEHLAPMKHISKNYNYN